MPKKHVLGWHNLLPFNTISYKLKSGFRSNSKAYVLIFCLAIKEKKKGINSGGQRSSHEPVFISSVQINQDLKISVLK